MGEALFGGPTHGVRTNATFRDAHLAWPPVLGRSFLITP
jgi:hypothetical protein